MKLILFSFVITFLNQSHGFVLIKTIFLCNFCPGIAMLTFALLMSARMGIFQEMLYKQYGKHSKEALFYNVSFFLTIAAVTFWEQP